MKQITPELRKRIQTEPASVEIIAELLRQTDPKDYCENVFYEGSIEKPTQACILGRLFYEYSNGSMHWFKDLLNGNSEADLKRFETSYRSLCSYKYVLKEDETGRHGLSTVNNGEHPEYQQSTPYKRLEAWVIDELAKKLGTINN